MFETVSHLLIKINDKRAAEKKSRLINAVMLVTKTLSDHIVKTSTTEITRT
jgi:hypothetical protein